MTDSDCIFCKIVAKQIPADLVYQDEQVTAFRDINPQMPVHVLVVPNQHVANTEALTPQLDAAVGGLIRAASKLADQQGVAQSGYRLVINTGPDALNSVAHLHIHLLGGRQMGWPPG
jgi:histidine triad (HIT) family protein